MCFSLCAAILRSGSRNDNGICGSILCGSQQPCVADLATSDTCDLAALQLAAKRRDVFAIDVAVTEDAKILTRVCTRRPCYLATVAVTVPDSGGYTYSIAVNENRRFIATHALRSVGESPTIAPCL